MKKCGENTLYIAIHATTKKVKEKTASHRRRKNKENRRKTEKNMMKIKDVEQSIHELHILLNYF